MTESTDPRPPRHTFELDVRLGRNDKAQIVAGLRTLADLIDAAPAGTREVTSPAYFWSITHDPTMTPVRYDAELTLWMEATRARRTPPVPPDFTPTRGVPR